jgi:hypothetical protein
VSDFISFGSRRNPESGAGLARQPIASRQTNKEQRDVVREEVIAVLRFPRY